MLSFSSWLQENTQLSKSSIYKYDHAVGSISRQMIDRGVIAKPIADMSLFEFDVSTSLILSDALFVRLNTVGNSMYSSALRHYRAFRVDCGLSISAEEAMVAIGSATDQNTERLTLIASRIGQGFFRREVLKRFNSECIFTRINCPKLLLASHIKPWAISTNQERLDPNNGLCLSPLYDRMFDIGLISFKNDGTLLLSSQIDSGNRSKLNLTNSVAVDIKSNRQQSDYLEYHRDLIFIR